MKTKIALACNNGFVTEHFGHCETFEVFVCDNKSVIKQTSLANPGHKPGFLPNFLNEQGVNVIISGGMGGGAVEIFNEKGIEVILGVKGEAKDVAERFLKGEIISSNSVCNHKH